MIWRLLSWDRSPEVGKSERNVVVIETLGLDKRIKFQIWILRFKEQVDNYVIQI